MLIQLFFCTQLLLFSFYFDFYFILIISRSFFLYPAVADLCGSDGRLNSIQSVLLVAGFFLLFYHLFFSLPKPKCTLNIQQAIALHRTYIVYIVHRTSFDIHISKYQNCNILKWFMSHTPQHLVEWIGFDWQQ